MRTETHPTIRLEDYRPSNFLIDRVDLVVRLDPTATRVTATLALRRNPEGEAGAPLVLDGDDLNLVSASFEGEELPDEAYSASPSHFTLHQPPRWPFTLTIETLLDPSANTRLMGLYRSSGVYCTQCEADGFRRITYFLDRPDVMAVYTTRIEAERDEAPVLLGNGNLVEAGEISGTSRHFAVWHDPHPKPAYLFALVGGRLGKIGRSFTTMDGRDVELAVFVEPGKEPRAGYALEAVARSMEWDEQAFGRAYDLDVFNVVAVSDFNMGAMENKGLNIFNDKFVLASPETATDQDYAQIEAIIAHEYFHNWSGNRVTCRDWFQLCLKEGLTVFRDQEFSSDMRSRAVHRISEVKVLRARQFPEDAGPLAHPVRPKQYAEINNFYTATVYEKGAEIVRMLKTLIGPEAFRAGMDRYFADNDGRAATVEDFLAAFAATAGRDLSHFAQWYERLGTPRLAVRAQHDPVAKTYRLEFTQTRPGAGADAPPLVIPIALGLVGQSGPLDRATSDRIENGIFVLTTTSDSLTFKQVEEPPVPSLLRDFSAPVRITQDLTDEEELTLLSRDSDAFNRWEAAQRVAMRIMVAQIRDTEKADPNAPTALGAALADFLDDEAERDPAFAALVLSLPSEGDIAADIAADLDPDSIHASRQALRRGLGALLSAQLIPIYEALTDRQSEQHYSPDAASAGRRALRNTALDLIAAGNPATGTTMAQTQFATATNMTDRLAALGVLSQIPGQAREEALAAFAQTYQDEPLVLDKWLSIQAMIAEDGTITRIQALQAHPAFTLSNPNRVRSLVGTFSLANPSQFHRADGEGYRLLAETVTALDPVNPQIAARLLTAFGSWRLYEPRRRAAAQSALYNVKVVPNLSRDTMDIVLRCLGNEPNA